MSVDKKEHIMNVAVALFAEKGFEGTSIRDLAHEADVNIAMINYYFGSKENLFVTLLEAKARFMREKIDAVQNDPSLSELEKINQIIDGYINRFLSQPAFHRVLQQELLVTNREMLHQNVISLFIKNTQDVVAIIEKGVRKKVFKKVDPQLLFASIIGTINQVMLSRNMCNILMNNDAQADPYQNPELKTRLTKHIKQMVQDHLLIQPALQKKK
ncbi:MAG: TetR family transcriptional regulator [Bacteroidetes bacterium]|nr:TetR family transcriptional regulator [Bacteroidota bacterium]